MADERSTSEARTEYEATLAEHSQLARDLITLEEWVDQPAEQPAAWIDGLGRQVTNILEALTRHFRREERSPMHTELPLSHPRFARPLERLMGEHESILDESRSLIAAAQSASEPEEALLFDLLRKTKLLISLLRRHEAEEDEIIYQVYYVDLGSE